MPYYQTALSNAKAEEKENVEESYIKMTHMLDFYPWIKFQAESTAAILSLAVSLAHQSRAIKSPLHPNGGDGHSGWHEREEFGQW